MYWARVQQFRYSHSVEDNRASPWSGGGGGGGGVVLVRLIEAKAAPRRRTPRSYRSLASLYGLEQRLELQRLDQLTKQVASMIGILLDERGTVDGICRLAQINSDVCEL
jgi:hypothetical protein